MQNAFSCRLQCLLPSSLECLLLQTFSIQLLERTNKVCCFSSSCQATSCHKTKRRASRQKIGEFLEALFVLYRPQTTKLSLPWPQHCKKTIQPKEFPVLYPSPSEENCARSIIYCAEISRNEATISLANAFPFVPLFWVKELHRAQSGLFMMRSFTAQFPKRNYFPHLPPLRLHRLLRLPPFQAGGIGQQYRQH